ncbi:MAG: ABC transporter ATP-binding protein [Acidobacteria bacterium]|nr:ABC transporter ATP-binding protein [Acidobacteriota bacterium]
MTAAIQLTGLTVEYGRRGFGARATRALDGVTLTVAPGDFMAIIGPNGSGKTTAIACLLGLRRPTAGTTRVFGAQLEAGTPAFRDIVYVPEEAQYHDYLTVEEVTRYYAALHGRPATDAALAAVFERLHLSSSRHTRIAACSKGMKQKVGLAQCLLQKPRLLVLDEPMRGLDPVAVREFRDVLAGLHRDGVTVLMSSHVLPEVEQLATRIAVLDSGRLLAVTDRDAVTGPLEDWLMATLGETRA